ncbi:MAG: phytoene/squalene synthase family protein [Planctomycetia bacterium]|nr:phytoene/squalene synthase family protein [Planctomycetia bacterium]
MMKKTELESSYELCAKICSVSGSNFVSAFRFLSSRQRRAMEVVYAFMRIADDLVDSTQSASERAERLDEFQNSFREKCISGNSLNSVLENLPEKREFSAIFPALAEVMREFAVPGEYFLEALRGVRMDLERSCYTTVEELETYCYHVASTVGLICLHIWGIAPEEIRPDAETDTFRAAVACGKALQWTNFLRDVVEDAQNGRLYLPLEDWEPENSVNSRDLLDSEKFSVYNPVAEEIRTAILRKDEEKLLPILRVNLERAERFYQESRTLLSLIPRENRPIFFLITEVYHEIFLKIRRNPTQIFERRVKLAKIEKMWLYVRSFFC